MLFEQQSCNNLSRERSFRSHNYWNLFKKAVSFEQQSASIPHPARTTSSSSPSPCTIVAHRHHRAIIRPTTTPSSSSPSLCHHPADDDFIIVALKHCHININTIGVWEKSTVATMPTATRVHHVRRSPRFHKPGRRSYKFVQYWGRWYGIPILHNHNIGDSRWRWWWRWARTREPPVMVIMIVVQWWRYGISIKWWLMVGMLAWQWAEREGKAVIVMVIVVDKICSIQIGIQTKV